MFDFLTSTTRERSFDFQVLTQYAIKKIYKTKHFLKPISATLSMEFRILSTSFFIIFSLIFPQISTGEDRLIAGESIRGNKTIVSAGEIFALGFFSPRNSTNRYIGIWYNKISEFTVVWVANKEDPITDATSNFTINHDGNLVLFDGRKNIVWSSNVSSVVGNRNITAVLLDTGNLELRSSNQTVLWQSFDHPFGSVLPGAKFYLNLKTGQSIRARSWTSADDPTPGTFSAGIDPRTPRQLLVSNGSIKYWRENVWYKELSASKPESDRNYIVYLSVLVYPNEIFYITSLSDNSIMARYVLIPTGQIQLQSWRQNSEKWNVLWSSKVNKCDVYARCGPSASCDYNSSTSACICLHGFKPRNEKDWEKGNWSGGCVREKALKCGERDGFATFEKTKLPDFSISFRNMSVNECEMKCLANCSCTAYAYTNGTGWVAANCLIWTGDLIDLVSSYGKLNLYVRLDASELGASGTSGFSIKKRHVVLIIISSVVAAGLLLLGFSAYFIRKRLKKDGASEPNPRYPASDLMVYKALASGKELPLFNFSSIVAATDNFSLSNKLGEGGFGPVYKGRLLGGEEVAVKRLSKTSGQGLEEFKNEVELIAKLQHRNLVRLLGWCVHGDDMILIYEFMPNKSLDKFIFETTQGTLLNWTTRFSIIQGIAQGLLYLHRHSRLRIIHRDLKSSNILLDETMNPKISDFGLARIFEGNQSQANTKRVAGTYGYMSPEYALDGHFSEKSDVFSFGVLLLEILSGKKNTGFYPYKQSVNLLGYAWELWREGRGLELIDPLIREPCATNEVMRSIHVSLLCVQENPSDRPSMSSVILLLGNESTDPPTPKQPAFSNMGFSISMDPSCSVSINNTINEASNNNSINGA